MNYLLQRDSFFAILWRHMAPVAIIAILHLVTACQAVAYEPPNDLETLTIETRNGRYKLTVEVAKTARAQQHGLMHRKSLKPRHGMLFPFRREDVAFFWMKDTPLALDMIFINKTGKVSKIVRSAQPNSTNIISSDKPVRMVLEFAAGTADELGITEGDRVIHPLVGGKP